eukprot:6673498-Alexandrium_andersonii.AAC.1
MLWSMPIPLRVSSSPPCHWSLAVAMPGIVLRPAASLTVAARVVPPCLTLRYHAKLAMPDTNECTHNALSSGAIPPRSPNLCPLCSLSQDTADPCLVIPASRA